MKVLLTASVLSHIAQFHKPLIGMLKEQGHVVHVAAADNLAEKDGLKLENIDRLFHIKFCRSPFRLANIAAYRKLCRLIEDEKYDIIHCNTPAVGVLTRLAARNTRKQNGTKVFYTAHGFHFFKGAPLKNWLLYYPIEKFMCRYTDTLVTITEEDAQLVKERFAVNHFHMHGVGADAARFFPVSEEEKLVLRQQLGLPTEARIILSAGELIPRKNMLTLIHVAKLLVPQVPQLRILIAGNGLMEHKLRAHIRQLGLEEHVTMLGYRLNVQQYMQAADLIVSCSLQEGLPVNIMEAMLVGKPVVVSDNRGHRELAQDGSTGFLIPPSMPEAYAERILQLFNSDTLCRSMSHAALERARQYTSSRIRPELERLYSLSSRADIPSIEYQMSTEKLSDSRRKKRVLILMSGDVGLYRFRKELLQELLHPGSFLPERAEAPAYEVDIALINGPFIPKLVDMGCRFFEVPLDRRGTNPLKDVRLFGTYLRILKASRPDIVLTYTIKPNVFGGLACRLLGLPYLPNVTGLGSSIEHPGALRQLALMMYRSGIAGARCTFFQNQANMDFMSKHSVGSKEKCLLPGSGVNLEEHPFCAYPDSTQGIRFLSLMRIMGDKGIAELLACAERVKKRHPHVTFTLAGRFEGERYRDAVENAHRMGWINYLGFRNDVEELMKQHHCIIHPSYHEGLSNVLLEAAACGRPIIASNVPGCAETFDEGISGFGFEVKNADQLSDRVEKFIQLPHEAKVQMSKAGRQKIEREFDRRKVVRAYISHIEKINT